jgi:hypothetical protein
LSLSFANGLTIANKSAIITMLSFFVFRKEITVYQICTVSFIPSGVNGTFFVSCQFILGTSQWSLWDYWLLLYILAAEPSQKKGALLC